MPSVTKAETNLQVIQAEQPMDLHRFWDGVITSSQNLTRYETRPRRSETGRSFSRASSPNLANTGFESWAKESFEIATKIAYRNGGADWDCEGWQYGLHDGRNGSCASCGLRC